MFLYLLELSGASVPVKRKRCSVKNFSSLASANKNGPSGNFGQAPLQLKSVGLNMLLHQALLFLMCVASLFMQKALLSWAGSQEADPVLMAVP